MSQITLKGSPVNTLGDPLEVGKSAPNFTLVDEDLNEVSLDKYKGKKILLNIFPSLDTGVCAQSIRQFYTSLMDYPEVTVLHVSKDLPFAMKRFCSVEAVPGAKMLSAFNSSFGQDYRIQMKDGPFKGLLARTVILIDEQGKIAYVQLVPEIGQEPDYSAAIAALRT